MTEATALALLVGTLCGTGFGCLIGVGITTEFIARRKERK